MGLQWDCVRPWTFVDYEAFMKPDQLVSLSLRLKALFGQTDKEYRFWFLRFQSWL